MSNIPAPDAVNLTARDLVAEVRTLVNAIMQDVLRMNMQGGEVATNAYARACMENLPERWLPDLVAAHDALGAALNAASPDVPPILSLDTEEPE